MTEQPFTAQTPGIYQVTATFTPPGGEASVIEAAYLGDPTRDPDAKLLYGRDIIREGITSYGNAASVVNTGPRIERVREVIPVDDDGTGDAQYEPGPWRSE